jgi:transposase-like protein
VRYALRDHDVEELLRACGGWVDPTTVLRWGQRNAPELDQRCRPSLRATTDAYRGDETASKIIKHWYDLYRAVDATGALLDFMLSARHDAGAAEHVFRKVRDAGHPTLPRVITVDKHAADPLAFDALQHDGPRPESCHSILKFFQVASTGMFRMTSSARYFKKGVGSSRPHRRWIMCVLEGPKANTSCKAWGKCFSFS